METVKATEIQIGDVIRFGARVTRVRIAKRVSILQEGHGGPVTYPLNSYVQVEREAHTEGAHGARLDDHDRF